MAGGKMSQKEYLRKYLNDGDIDSKKKPKKKKKRPAIGTKTVKIIDDDIDLHNIRPLEDGEFQILNTTEDAPQIVGIVDERGPAVDFADKRRWRIIADDEDGNVTCGLRNDIRKDRDDNPAPSKDTRSSDKRGPEKSARGEDSDLSPPRSSRKASPSEKKSKRKRREPSSESSSSSDLSSPERKAKRRSKHKRKNDRSDSDQSPPRRKASKDKSSESVKNSKNSGHLKGKPSARGSSDSDQSPPRRKTNKDRSSGSSRNLKNSGSDSVRGDRDSRLKEKPPVRRCSDSDQSPPRRKKNDESTRDSEADFSPPRRKRKDERGSGRNDRGSSRSGRDVRDARSRDDPGRGRRDNRRDEENNSRGSRSRWNDDERPPKKRSRSPEATSPDDNAGSGRMKKTLDGKTAGLQEARDLRLETEAYKKREAESFKQLSSEVSGVGQATIFRDRKTGRRRDLAAEAAQRREKDKRQAEIDEKYAKWGKGLKQVDEAAEKRERDLYEMSKPLARYANDADLDKALREVEREGDTMLDEIRKRRVKEGKCEPARPIYRGSYAPNRFGIKPGHRWDGVDRSNGYEKKWFEARNARKAIAEEAYKWSTADM